MTPSLPTRLSCDLYVGIAPSSSIFQLDLPLFFINSAIVETGERGVFSPVDLASFSLAADLYGLSKQHHPLYNLPLITCVNRSEEHTSELQSLMRISYAVF